MLIRVLPVWLGLVRLAVPLHRVEGEEDRPLDDDTKSRSMDPVCLTLVQQAAR